MVHLHAEDIRVGCNKYPGCLAVGTNGVTIYGAYHSVAIANLALVKVITLLRGHNAEVTCVKWISNMSKGFSERFFQPEVEFVSAAADGSILVWRLDPLAETGWNIQQKLVGHKSTVTGIDVSLIF